MSDHLDTAVRRPTAAPNRTAAGPRVWRAARRQHRAWVIGALALVAVGGVALFVATALVPACATKSYTAPPGGICNYRPANIFFRLFVLAMTTMPVIVGAVLGAVTFGADVEHRTQVWALTQGVGRTRWWVSKVVVTGVPVALAVAALGLATLGVVDASDNDVIDLTRVSSSGFEVVGVTPAVVFLLAYAAAAAGALRWRAVGGLVTGFVVAVVVAAGGTLLQPLVVPHHRESIPVQAWLADEQTASPFSPPDNSAYNWAGYTDAAGRDVDLSGVDCSQWPDCLATARVAYRIETWVDDATYPLMAVVIDGIDLVIAGALLGVGLYRLRRRDLGAG